MVTVEFQRELADASTRPEIESNPFVRGIRDGSVPRAAIRPYAVEIAALATTFPRVLASVLARCEGPEARRLLLENILEEVGAVSFATGDGLTIRPERAHPQLALKLVRAVGGGDDDIHRRAARSGWLATELDESRWIGPLAYLTVGFESNVPRAFGPIVDGFRRHYGFSEDEIEFYVEHLDADQRHGAQGLEIVASVATSDATRAEALEGVRRGALEWWHLHRKHNRAARSTA